MDEMENKLLPTDAQDKGLELNLLTRAANQDFYAEQLADLVEGRGLMTAPVNLKDSIMERSRQLDVQVIAKSNTAARKLELFYYGLKITAAVAVSVCFILIAPSLAERQFPGAGQDTVSYSQDDTLPSSVRVPIHERFSSRLKDLSGAAQEFFNESLNMEVFLHD